MRIIRALTIASLVAAPLTAFATPDAKDAKAAPAPTAPTTAPSTPATPAPTAKAPAKAKHKAVKKPAAATPAPAAK